MKKNLLFGLVTAVVIFTGLAVTQSPRGYAEENIFPTRFEGETHLSGQSMVWQQDGGDGYQQVTVQNITTGEKKQITHTTTKKRFTNIGGTLVTWQEKRDMSTPERDWDVYAYDLTTGTEKKLNETSGTYGQPSTDGDYIVWSNGGSIHVYNWKQDTRTSVGEGIDPIINKGNILFKSKEGLNLHNIATGVTNLVAAAPEGYAITWFAFQGETALLILNKFNEGNQYAILKLGGSKPEIDYVTPLAKKKRDFSQMAVGNHYVVWLEEDKDGVPQLMGARVDDGSAVQLTQAKASDVQPLPIGFIGDTLIWVENYFTTRAMPLNIEKSTSGSLNYAPIPNAPKPEPIKRPRVPEKKFDIAPSAPMATESEIQIEVNVEGHKMQFDEQPFIEEGTTLVQFRPIFEKLGLQIQWDGDTQTITGSADGVSIRLQINKPEAFVNGVAVDLEEAPRIEHEVTVVPLRFVGEATGRKVIWDDKLHAVYIIAPETVGKLLYPNGKLKYEGQLKNGKMNGKGKLYREDGTLWYDAEFMNDAVEGTGTFIQQGLIDGNDMTNFYYVGEIKHGIPDGQGKGYDPRGRLIYQGGFENGKYAGHGKYFVNGKIVYDGDFVMSQYDGYGKLYSGGYLLYEGQFKANNRHGKGKLYEQAFHHTLDYEGEFKNDIFNGEGSFYSSIDSFYTGQWVNGKKEGIGKEYSSYLLDYEGEFHNGVREGNGKLFESDRRIYEGMFKNGKPEGKGKLTDEYGKIIFEGQFLDGKPAGS
ncbi:stalk domain-containing protein [Paenibacillus alginolyticus]|uniref:stalk domain-containing protein n=1 Tax=Paenibacillus alginolyticus TaxID=59839 RepID=UPI000FD9873E|nr:stalk domain-containing protein [Paenibacillus alginolyticus]MCY9666317.1 stalk domain-containing protein [Paenibacillus alginolyticus]